MPTTARRSEDESVGANSARLARQACTGGKGLTVVGDEDADHSGHGERGQAVEQQAQHEVARHEPRDQRQGLRTDSTHKPE